jgi:hypothetical protein
MREIDPNEIFKDGDRFTTGRNDRWSLYRDDSGHYWIALDSGELAVGGNSVQLCRTRERVAGMLAHLGFMKLPRGSHDD